MESQVVCEKCATSDKEMSTLLIRKLESVKMILRGYSKLLLEPRVKNVLVVLEREEEEGGLEGPIAKSNPTNDLSILILPEEGFHRTRR